jgi:hypothetical protein
VQVNKCHAILARNSIFHFLNIQKVVFMTTNSKSNIPYISYWGWREKHSSLKHNFVPAVSLSSFPHSRGRRRDPLDRDV